MRRLAVPFALLALVALAALLRFPGIDYLLPGLTEPDAHILVQVELIERGDPHPEESIDWGKYPHLVAWATVALTAWRQWGSLPVEAPLEEHLALAIDPAVRVRWTVALLSLLLVPVSFWLARLYLPRKWALAAALLAGTSLLAVHFSTQGRPHGAAAALPALAVLACVQARRRPGWGWMALAAAACGLALAGLQSGVAAFLAFGAALLLTWRGRGARHLALALLPLAAFAVAIVVFYPFWLEGSQGGRVELEGSTLDQAGHKIDLGGFNGRSFPLLARALFSWEPALAVGALLGLLAWAVGRLRGTAPERRLPLADHLVVLAYALSYAFVIGLYHRSYERFLLPLVPFLAALAAFGLWRLWSAAAARPARLAAGLAAALLLAFPTVVAAQLVRIRTAPSTYELAAEWVERELEPRERVALNIPLVLPLYRTPESVAADLRPRAGARNLLWVRYQEEALGAQRGGPAYAIDWLPLQRKAWRRVLVEEPEVYVRSLPQDYALIEVFEEGRIDPSGVALRRALDRLAEPQARFSPDGDPDRYDTPLVYQDETGGTVPWMALRVLRAERMGAVLQAYRLPRRQAARPVRLLVPDVLARKR